MTRKKKTRSGGGQTVYIDVPRRSEKLADPDSYESRKRKNQEQKKKKKSVYQKAVEADQNGASGQQQRETRLAEKIRKLKAKEKADDSASEDS